MSSDKAATVHGDPLRGERERQRQRDDGGQHGARREEGQEPVGPEGHSRSGDIPVHHSHRSKRFGDITFLLQVPPIPKDPDSVESECYNPHKEARKKKNGVDNPAFRWSSSRHSFSKSQF